MEGLGIVTGSRVNLRPPKKSISQARWQSFQLRRTRGQGRLDWTWRLWDLWICPSIARRANGWLGNPLWSLLSVVRQADKQH